MKQLFLLGLVSLSAGMTAMALSGSQDRVGKEDNGSVGGKRNQGFGAAEPVL